MPVTKDLAGQRFGKLSVVESAGRTQEKRPKPLWLCQCDCGRREVVQQKQLIGAVRSIRECYDCRRPRCEVCGIKIPEGYGSKTVCSDEHRTVRKREKDREQYYRRIEKDPDINRRQWQRKKEKAEEDPAYAARLREYEQRSLLMKREKRRADEAWAEKDREASRQRYEERRNQILERRKIRRQIDTEYRTRRREQEQSYYWRHREKRLEARKEAWQSLPDEEKARRLEQHRRANRINKRRRMAEIRRDPERYREYQARQRAWERERNLKRLFTTLDKLRDFDDE